MGCFLNLQKDHQICVEVKQEESDTEEEAEVSVFLLINYFTTNKSIV